MLAIPDRLKSFAHPLVSSIYKKMDYSTGSENVLVIETRFPDADEDEGSSDSYLMDLLLDLNNLKLQAESRLGHIDRVDIRTS
jgi:hypothetical protein